MNAVRSAVATTASRNSSLEPESRDGREHPRQQARPDDVGEGQEDRGLDQGRRERDDDVAAGERRQRDDEHDRRDVLDDRPADRRAAVGAVDLAAVDERLEDDERRREGQAGADDQRLPQVRAEEGHDERARRRGSGAIWAMPPGMTTRPTERSSRIENSTPSANRSRTTPTSARMAICSWPPTKPGRERADEDAGEHVADDGRLAQADRDGAADQRRHDGPAEVEDELELLGQLDAA